MNHNIRVLKDTNSAFDSCISERRITQHNFAEKCLFSQAKLDAVKALHYGNTKIQSCI